MSLRATIISLAVATALTAALTLTELAEAQTQHAAPPPAAAPEAAPADRAAGTTGERKPTPELQPAAPEELSQPPPGCSYRNNKLDLIV